MGRRRRGVPAPLRLTLPEAMAVVPVRAARHPLRGQVRAEPRVRVREARRGPAGRPPPARRGDARRPLAAPGRPGLQPPRRGPHEGLGGAPGRALPVPAGPLRRHRAASRRTAEVRAVPARAVARDPRAVPDRLRQDARRDAHVQGRADRWTWRSRRRRSRRPSRRDLAATLRRAWDIIADQPPTEVVLRFDARVAARGSARRPGTRARRSTSCADGSLEWRARVAGTIEIRLWILSWGDEVEVIAPTELRADVAATHARAAARYARPGPAR